MTDPLPLSEVLLVQCLAWRNGQRPPIEELLRRHAHLADDPESVLDLIYQEIVLREEVGEQPSLQDYAERFPALLEALKVQFEIDEALTLDVPPRDPVSTVPAPQRAGGLESLPRLEGVDLLDELGRGAMGVVYRGWQQAARRPVAVKVLASEMPAGRAKTEVEAATRLQHPHIVTVHEVKEWAGRVALVMEYVEGGNLAEKLDGKPQRPSESARFIETLAWAMAYAHGRGVIHRDLKPSNILLSAGPDTPLGQCQPRISDFGLAKLVEASAHLTKTNDVLGTPSYMAPEQAASASEAGPAADIYALGAVLYECLTGRPPFLGQNLLDTLDQVRRLDPVPPSRLVANCPRDLEVICLKCLHKQPQKRYASCKELAEDLRRYLNGEPIQARPVGWWERTWKWAVRHPLGAALLLFSVIAGAALLLGGYVFAVVQNTARKQAEEQADRLSEQLERTRQLLYTAQLLRVGVMVQTDPAQGLRMLRSEEACPLDLRCFTWGVLHALCKPHDHVEFHARPVVGLTATPDGRHSITATADGLLHLWAGRGQNRRSWTLPSGRPVGLTASATLLAVATDQGKVWLWDLNTGRERGELVLGKDRVAGLALSPDGRWLAINSAPVGALRGTLSVWDLQLWRKRKTMTEPTQLRCGVAFSRDGNWLACAGTTNGVYVWHRDTGKLRRTYAGHTTAVRCLAFGPDGASLVAGAQDGSVLLWDVVTGQERKQFRSVVGPLRALAVHPQGKEVAVAGEGRPGEELARDVQVWCLDEEGNEDALRAHAGSVGVVYTEDGKALLTAGADRTLKWWASPRPLRSLALRSPLAEPSTVAMTSDGQRLAWILQEEGQRPAAAALYSRYHRATVQTLRGHDKPMRTLALSPDGRRAVSVGVDDDEESEVLIWDLDLGRHIQRLNNHPETCHAVAFSLQGRHLATAAADGVRLFALDVGRDTWKELWHYKTGAVAVAFADGQVLALGEDLRAWRFNGEEVMYVELPARAEHLAVDRDGSTVVVGDREEGVVHLLNVATGEWVAVDVGMKEVWHAAFSPDGTALAVAGPSHGVKLWDVATRQERAALGARGACFVGFTSDASTLLTVTRQGGKAHFWYRSRTQD